MIRELEIRFDNMYEKLPPDCHGKEALLIECIVVDPSLQTKAFLDYDTKVRGKDEYYKLKPGLKLLLLFVIPGPPGIGAGTFFTTFRSFDFNEEMFYRHARGDKFRIRIETRTQIKVESTHESNARKEGESDIHAQGGV